jgi:hypothetical protein
MMKVFVSWSGERSHLLAEAVYEWLPLVLHYVAPWLSNADIEAGERWANEVAKELESSNFGIISVTRENVASPWILFEAGALAKSLQGSRVIPLLLDLEFRDITGPLAQFQAKKVDKLGLSEIVASINQNAPQPVQEARVKQLFDALWPDLEKRIGGIPKQTTPTKHARSQPEVLEELVTGVRALDARVRDILEDSGRLSSRRRRKFHPFMIEEMLHRFARKRNDPLGILIIASLVREEVPWLYEIGLQAYRDAQSGNRKAAQSSLRRFKEATKMLLRGPLPIEEFGMDPRMMDMFGHMIERYIEPSNSQPDEEASISETEVSDNDATD